MGTMRVRANRTDPPQRTGAVNARHRFRRRTDYRAVRVTLTGVGAAAVIFAALCAIVAARFAGAPPCPVGPGDCLNIRGAAGIPLLLGLSVFLVGLTLICTGLWADFPDTASHEGETVKGH